MHDKPQKEDWPKKLYLENTKNVLVIFNVKFDKKFEKS